MKPRILLTGSSGQIGRELSFLLPALADVVSPPRSALDLANAEAVRRTIREYSPQLIVNAAAYTAVDQAETETAAAHAENALAPAVMAEEAGKLGALLVHYSTDYVFDGAKSSPYDEADPPNPVNVYGKTKLAGEEAIRASGVAHFIFRTSWVYAPHGRNFLLTILRLSTQREELRIVCDQRGAPTWSREIAAATIRILTPLAAQGWKPDLLAAVSGTYHMTAAGETSWHQFAEAILEERSHAPRDTPWIAAATGNLPQITRRVTPISTAEYPTPARRPAYSVLSNSRLLQSFGFQLPGWREQLHSVFQAC
jgi:dTDP-4-dehydrorhamnose reductase